MTSLKALEERLNYHFIQSSLLQQAMTHKSASNENKDKMASNNERLEYLGDAVLDLLLADALMKAHPFAEEGWLSKRRAALVNESVLADLSTQLGLPEFLRLGRGEEQSGGLKKPRLLASAFEALTGALYLDGGLTAAQKLIDLCFQNLVVQNPESDTSFEQDYKTRLQEFFQKKWGQVPTYRLIDSRGPEHSKEFEVEVLGQDASLLGTGIGKTKKQAEQKAAEVALLKIRQESL